MLKRHISRVSADTRSIEVEAGGTRRSAQVAGCPADGAEHVEGVLQQRAHHVLLVDLHPEQKKEVREKALRKSLHLI